MPPLQNQRRPDLSRNRSPRWPDDGCDAAEEGASLSWASLPLKTPPRPVEAEQGEFRLADAAAAASEQQVDCGEIRRDVCLLEPQVQRVHERPYLLDDARREPASGGPEDDSGALPHRHQLVREVPRNDERRERAPAVEFARCLPW